MSYDDRIERFERAYAERSNTTVERLHYFGRFGALCDCGEDGYEGFQMLHLKAQLVEAGWTQAASPPSSRGTA